MWVYYYSGVVRPTDHEMTTTENTICYSQLPREEGTYHSVQGHMEKEKGCIRGGRVGRNMGKNLYYGFHGGGTAEAGKPV